MDAVVHLWDTGYLWAALLSLLFGTYLFRKWKFLSETPPGPWGLPVVGNLPFFSKQPHKNMIDLVKKYGNIYSLQLGMRYVVVLNGYEVIKEAFVKQGDIFAGKPKDDLSAYFGENKNLFVTDGEVWREQHRFLLSALKDFGFGKKSLEEYAQNEAKEAVQILQEERGQACDMLKIAILMANNVIVSLIFSERYPYGDPNFELILKMFAMPEGMTNFTYLESFPIIKSLPQKLTGFDQMAKLFAPFYNFLDVRITQHEKEFDENNPPRDMLDAYLLKIHQLEKSGNKMETGSTVFTKDHMRQNIAMLFGTGLGTTALTFAFMIKILAAHPEVQNKIQKEIDSLIGRERSPTMTDRPKMPYTEAVLTESYRYISLITWSNYHRTTANTELFGYKIPKETMIIANFWSVHRDPKTWTNANKFDPERFLGDPETVSKLKERVIPFSIGKRSCIGEWLAKMELFIYLTTFLQHFTFKPPEVEKFHLEPISFTPMPHLDNYRVCAIPRD